MAFAVTQLQLPVYAKESVSQNEVQEYTVSENEVQEHTVSENDAAPVIELTETLQTTEAVPNVHMTDADGKLTQAEVTAQIDAQSGDADKFTVTFADNITTIGESAFRSFSGLTGGLDLNQVTTIEKYVFKDCSNLNGQLSMPNVQSVGNSAFEACQNLTGGLNLPKATTIEDYAFSACYGLNGTISLPEATSIGKFAFKYCSNLTGDLDLPKVTTIGETAFGECSGLNGNVTLSALTDAGMGALSDLTNVKNITTNGPARDVSIYSTDCVASGDMTFTVGSGINLECWGELTIGEGGTLKNHGIITILGTLNTLNNNGTIDMRNGTFTNNGTLQGTGTMTPLLTLQESDFSPASQSMLFQQQPIDLQAAGLNLFSLPGRRKCGIDSRQEDADGSGLYRDPPDRPAVRRTAEDSIRKCQDRYYGNGSAYDIL